MSTGDEELEFLLDPPLDDALTRILIELWVDSVNAGGAVGFVPPVTVEVVEPVAVLAFRRVIGGLDHLVVGRAKEHIIGFAFLEQRPGPLFRHWATVKRLQVHPSLRGRGLGSALLDAAHGAARELGLEQLYVTVRDGTGTEDFYARHGYEEVARIPGAIRVGPNQDLDEIYMVKRF